MTTLLAGITDNWPVWIVSVTLVIAAVIDGLRLKVPNWITAPMILSGLVYSAWATQAAGGSWLQGLVVGLLGAGVGLLLLLPAYAIGGMGAGDVKLLAGIGAWMHAGVTLEAFAVSALVGAVLAIVLVIYHNTWTRHRTQFWQILQEIVTIRNPDYLSMIAAERKPRMLLLPYGIPIAIGTIGYFLWNGMLV
jgi:prepilin peptidase CpaA